MHVGQYHSFTLQNDLVPTSVIINIQTQVDTHKVKSARFNAAKIAFSIQHEHNKTKNPL